MRRQWLIIGRKMPQLNINRLVLDQAQEQLQNSENLIEDLLCSYLLLAQVKEILQTTIDALTILLQI